MRTIREVLLAAAVHIEKVGLYKGAYYKPTEGDEITPTSERPCCAYGALGVVMGCSPNSYNLDQVVDCLKAGLEIYHIPRWNDHPVRTKEDVVAGFRRAAQQECALADAFAPSVESI